MSAPISSPPDCLPEPLSAALRNRLRGVGVGTLAVQLRKRGFDTAVIEGVRPLTPGTTLVGTARTLRYVPRRKDLAAALGGGHNHQKQAINTLRAGDVLVMEARGCTEAGTFGDILALRALQCGAAGVITDGANRDSADIRALGLPVFSAGSHPLVPGHRLIPLDHDQIITCGGATVCVGDVIVGDDDGVLVIPRSEVDDVLAEAEAHEHKERFAIAELKRGEDLEGLWPLTAQRWKDRYAQWLADNPPPAR